MAGRDGNGGVGRGWHDGGEAGHRRTSYVEQRLHETLYTIVHRHKHMNLELQILVFGCGRRTDAAQDERKTGKLLVVASFICNCRYWFLDAADGRTQLKKKDRKACLLSAR